MHIRDKSNHNRTGQGGTASFSRQLFDKVDHPGYTRVDLPIIMITCITYHCHNRDPILSIFKKQQCVSLVWIFYQELVGGKLSLCVSKACQIFVTRSHEWVRVVPVDHQCHCSKIDHMSEFLKYASSACPPLLTPDWPGLPLEAPKHRRDLINFQERFTSV